jgi:hypothetical protein
LQVLYKNYFKYVFIYMSTVLFGSKIKIRIIKYKLIMYCELYAMWIFDKKKNFGQYKNVPSTKIIVFLNTNFLILMYIQIIITKVFFTEVNNG